MNCDYWVEAYLVKGVTWKFLIKVKNKEWIVTIARTHCSTKIILKFSGNPQAWKHLKLLGKADLDLENPWISRTGTKISVGQCLTYPTLFHPLITRAILNEFTFHESILIKLLYSYQINVGDFICSFLIVSKNKYQFVLGRHL